MTPAAQLLLPAIRWDSQHGFDREKPAIDAALALGVGGFIVFGGEQDAVRLLTRDLRNRSRVPLLIGADMERGAGQQFGGATGLPPAAAIASLGDVEAVRKVARLTAREARTLGVNWDYAPVCDLDLVPENPIVGTRAFGADARAVAQCVTEWITACQSEGVLACAKHFPGHGRTTMDSHAGMPVVDASKKELLETDLVPFRAAIEAGVASIMTAHVAYPALDESGAPATLSREILRWFLRESLKFDGLVVTDALIMEGFRQQGGEAEAATRALDAGCDLLLYPEDLPGVARRLTEALDRMELDRERVGRSYRRRLKWAQWSAPPNDYRRPSLTDVAWGAQLADRVVRQVRGASARIGTVAHLLIVDDDVGGPYPAPSREPLLRALAAAGTQVRKVDAPRAADAASTVIAVFGDVRAWKGRAGYSAETRAAVARACAAAPDATVVHFSHPRLADELGEARNLVCAWGGEAAMQQAAARWLLRGGRPAPSA
ncbi:MAG TPA: glycoside hydrolase family 3 N-terminal domain-containing protein [Gemmatimonadaceae bacterium]|nr:glycoside hydrolase family 3 N-terminal domain-containing protein [Gemmatimonadaceae bacterium]